MNIKFLPFIFTLIRDKLYFANLVLRFFNFLPTPLPKYLLVTKHNYVSFCDVNYIFTIVYTGLVFARAVDVVGIGTREYAKGILALMSLLLR